MDSTSLHPQPYDVHWLYPGTDLNKPWNTCEFFLPLYRPRTSNLSFCGNQMMYHILREKMVIIVMAVKWYRNSGFTEQLQLCSIRTFSRNIPTYFQCDHIRIYQLILKKKGKFYRPIFDCCYHNYNIADWLCTQFQDVWYQHHWTPPPQFRQVSSLLSSVVDMPSWQ